MNGLFKNLFFPTMVLLLHVNALEPGCFTTFTPEKSMHPYLLEMLSITNIFHDNTLESIVAATQKEQPEGWLRARGMERWQIADAFSEMEAEIQVLAQKMGLLQEIAPSRTEYNSVFLLGATITRVRKRLAYLIELWNRGVRFKKLYILGGKRPLDNEVESKGELLNLQNGVLESKKDWQLQGKLPETETEMIKMIFDQAVLPQEWEALSIEHIDLPMKVMADGRLERPITLDTVKAAFEKISESETILAISNQPFVCYQDVVVRLVAPSEHFVETVGAQATEVKNSILLDTLARMLHMALQKENK